MMRCYMDKHKEILSQKVLAQYKIWKQKQTEDQQDKDSIKRKSQTHSKIYAEAEKIVNFKKRKYDDISKTPQRSYSTGYPLNTTNVAIETSLRSKSLTHHHKSEIKTVLEAQNKSKRRLQTQSIHEEASFLEQSEIINIAHSELSATKTYDKK